MSGGLKGPAPDDRPQPDARRNDQGIRIDPAVEAEAEPRRAVLSGLVRHEPGVLAKVSGLFSRRQFNIESLTVGPTLDDDYARITLVTEEPGPGVEQARRQFEKLVPVLSVRELDADAVERELALVKVDADEPDKIQSVTEMHDGKVVDVTRETVTVEVTGPEEAVDAAIETFERFTIREIVRTGTAALARGTQSTGNP